MLASNKYYTVLYNIKQRGTNEPCRTNTTDMEKIQYRKIGVAGNGINQFMGNNSSLPVVGEGATMLHYSDRSCFDVVAVGNDGNSATLQHLRAERNPVGPSGYGHQNWVLIPVDGAFTEIVWRKNAWYIVGQEIVFEKEFLQKVINAGTITWKYLKETDKELYEKVYGDDIRPRLVEGVTRIKKTYSKISILFGVKDYYYDWEF